MERGLIYKQISFFECEAVEVRIGRVLSLRRARALARNEAIKNVNLYHKNDEFSCD